MPTIINKASDLSSIVYKDNKFIFDTNIWIKLLPNCFQEKDRVEVLSSEILQNILDNNSEIAILQVIISELFNVFIKKRYEYHKKNKGTNYAYKKDYRASSEYEKDKNFFIDEFKDNILGFCQRKSDEFSNLDIDKVLDKKQTHYDFNDNYLVRFCEETGYTLVTNDKDCLTYSNINFECIYVK